MLAYNDDPYIHLCDHVRSHLNVPRFADKDDIKYKYSPFPNAAEMAWIHSQNHREALYMHVVAKYTADLRSRTPQRRSIARKTKQLSCAMSCHTYHIVFGKKIFMLKMNLLILISCIVF